VKIDLKQNKNNIFQASFTELLILLIFLLSMLFISKIYEQSESIDDLKEEVTIQQKILEKVLPLNRDEKHKALLAKMNTEIKKRVENKVVNKDTVLSKFRQEIARLQTLNKAKDELVGRKGKGIDQEECLIALNYLKENTELALEKDSFFDKRNSFSNLNLPLNLQRNINISSLNNRYINALNDTMGGRESKNTFFKGQVIDLTPRNKTTSSHYQENPKNQITSNSYQENPKNKMMDEVASRMGKGLNRYQEKPADSSPYSNSLAKRDTTNRLKDKNDINYDRNNKRTESQQFRDFNKGKNRKDYNQVASNERGKSSKELDSQPLRPRNNKTYQGKHDQIKNKNRDNNYKGKFNHETPNRPGKSRNLNDNLARKDRSPGGNQARNTKLDQDNRPYFGKGKNSFIPNKIANNQKSRSLHNKSNLKENDRDRGKNNLAKNKTKPLIIKNNNNKIPNNLVNNQKSNATAYKPNNKVYRPSNNSLASKQKSKPISRQSSNNNQIKNKGGFKSANNANDPIKIVSNQKGSFGNHIFDNNPQNLSNFRNGKNSNKTSPSGSYGGKDKAKRKLASIPAERYDGIGSDKNKNKKLETNNPETISFYNNGQPVESYKVSTPEADVFDGGDDEYSFEEYSYVEPKDEKDNRKDSDALQKELLKLLDNLRDYLENPAEYKEELASAGENIKEIKKKISNLKEEGDRNGRACKLELAR